MSKQIIVDTPMGVCDLIDWEKVSHYHCSAVLRHIESKAEFTWWNITFVEARSMSFDLDKMSMWTDSHGNECGTPGVTQSVRSRFRRSLLKGK